MNVLNRFGATAMTGLAVAAIAATVALAGPIEDRQAAMKEVGKAMGKLAAIAKKEADFDAAVVKEQATVMAEKFKAAKEMWPDGSDKGDKETWSKAEIWSDRETFDKDMSDAVAAAEEVAAVTEEANFLPAMQKLGASCGACHKQFRRPKE